MHCETAFRLLWSLKEATVKARGDGIVFDMQRLEMVLPTVAFPAGPVGETTVCVDSAPSPLWAYTSAQHAGHWFSVARCPPSEVVDEHGEFTATMAQRVLAPDAWARAAAAPAPPFTRVTVADLLPAHVRSEYDRVAG